MEWIRDNYRITTRIDEFDFDVIYGFLSREAYWCKGVPVNVVRKAVNNSLCFAVFNDGPRYSEQIGFARAITDKATFAYLADVFVLEPFRGRGISKWLIECVLSHPDLQELRRFVLATQDAHGLYKRYGFQPLTDPVMFMELHKPDIYLRGK